MRRFSPFMQLMRQENGVISILFAILLPLVIGFLALATDTGIWYVNQRNMQAATDLATLSAGKDIGRSDSSQLTSAVKAEAARNGFSEADGVVFTISYPPVTGSHIGNMNALEVQLSQEQTRFFSMLNTSADPVASARSVALRTASGEACVLALHENAAQAVSFQGNPNVILDGCIIASNSSDNCAISIGGSADLEADNLYTVGDYCTTGGAYTLDLDQTPITSGTAIVDPYADLSDPSYGSCDKNNYKAKNTETLNPGVYCGDFTINANANITLNPGTYYVHGGDLNINGGANVYGNGVTIVMTGTGSGVGNVDINGTANLNLTAPAEGSGAPYEGILFYQDRDAPSSGTNKINGNASNNLVGSLYFPKQAVEFSGNSTSGSSCLRLVASTVRFSGNSGMSHHCETVGGDNITTEDTITLVE